MLKQYEEELQELTERMQKAEKFANALPVFRDEIIERKISGNEEWLVMASRYKDTPYPWNINRGYYRTGGTRTITNYKGKSYNTHLFNMYFNTVSLFGGHEKHGLSKLCEIVDVFYFDSVNSTFYVTDNNIEVFLEAANDWYLKAKVADEKVTKEKRLAKLKKELELLTGDSNE